MGISDRKRPLLVNDCNPLTMGEPRNSKHFDSTHSIICPCSSMPRKLSLVTLSRIRNIKARLIRYRIDSKKNPTFGCTMLNTLEICKFILFCAPNILLKPKNKIELKNVCYLVFEIGFKLFNSTTNRFHIG